MRPPDQKLALRWRNFISRVTNTLGSSPFAIVPSRTWTQLDYSCGCDASARPGIVERQRHVAVLATEFSALPALEVEADNPGASAPGNAASASPNSPVDTPLMYIHGINFSNLFVRLR